MHAYVSTCFPTGQVPAMAVAETQAPTPRNPCGEALVAELRWVHDGVETAARELSDAADPAARNRLIRALRQLSADLLAHLEYEEDHISDTLRTWPDWPFG